MLQERLVIQQVANHRHELTYNSHSIISLHQQPEYLVFHAYQDPIKIVTIREKIMIPMITPMNETC